MNVLNIVFVFYRCVRHLRIGLHVTIIRILRNSPTRPASRLRPTTLSTRSLQILHLLQEYLGRPPSLERT